jgi:O-antigen biosynthesis protein
MVNEGFKDPDSWYYNIKKERIASLIPAGRNVVLDIGCGSGKLGEHLLRQGKAVEVVGVEMFSPAARKAAKVYSRIIEGDIEKIEIMQPQHFDYVICGDILEHLVDPWALMKRIRGWLKAGGSVIVSIPNVRYFRVIWDLAVRGNWEYTDAGILERTHLRFFTRKTLAKMIMQGGLDLIRCEMVICGKKQGFNFLTLGLFQDWLGGQILAVAYKS